MEAIAILLWLFFAVVVGTYAERRGRSGMKWFFLSLLFSPVLMGILVLALGPADPDSSDNRRVRCPDCRELVRTDARKCKHCGTALTPAS